MARVWGVFILFGFLFLYIRFFIIGSDDPQTSSAAPVKTASAPPNEKAYSACKKRLATAMTNGLFINASTKFPVQVQVGLRFYGLTLAQKQSFGDDINCLIMHGSTDTMDFDFIDGHSGKPAGSYHLGRYKAN